MDNCHIEHMYRLNTEFSNTTEVCCNSFMHGCHSNINDYVMHISLHNLSMAGILCVQYAIGKNRTIKTLRLMLADQQMLNFNNRY